MPIIVFLQVSTAVEIGYSYSHSATVEIMVLPRDVETQGYRSSSFQILWHSREMLEKLSPDELILRENTFMGIIWTLSTSLTQNITKLWCNIQAWSQCPKSTVSASFLWACLKIRRAAQEFCHDESHESWEERRRREEREEWRKGEGQGRLRLKVKKGAKCSGTFL